MKAQELLDISKREGSVEITEDGIWLYTQSALIEESGSEFIEPNPYEEEKENVSLLQAPYWVVELGVGSWNHPIHNAQDLQKYLDQI